MFVVRELWNKDPNSPRSVLHASGGRDVLAGRATFCNPAVGLVGGPLVQEIRLLLLLPVAPPLLLLRCRRLLALSRGETVCSGLFRVSFICLGFV